MHDEFRMEDVDQIIHSRVRLGVMAYLAAADLADFSTLKKRLSLTEGTLSVHLRKLEEAGYITITKSFKDRRSLTQAKLTGAGRKAFRAYVEAMGKLAGLGG